MSSNLPFVVTTLMFRKVNLGFGVEKKCSFFIWFLNGTLFPSEYPEEVFFFYMCMYKCILKQHQNVRWTEVLQASVNKCKSEVYPLEYISKIFLNFSMQFSGRGKLFCLKYLSVSPFRCSIYRASLFEKNYFSPSHLFLIGIMLSICSDLW